MTNRCRWLAPVPVVSLFADTAIVIGMTANGGIIEGRLEFAHSA